MMTRGLAAPHFAHFAQLALAALICTALCACGPDDSTGSGAGGVGASGSTGGLTVITRSGSGTGTLSNPSDKSITLSWSRPRRNSDGSSLTDLAGYTLHYGTAPQDYTGSIEITSPMQTSYIINGSTFPPGKYYFAISAYNTEQVSSSLSAEVSVALD